MSRWSWGLTTAPDGSHHLEHQSMTGWEVAAWTAAFTVGAVTALVSLWPLATVALYFSTFPGWQRRWIRIDHRYVRVGWTVFARGDVVGVRVADRVELSMVPDPHDPGTHLPRASNVRVRAGIPRGVLVKTRTPEGQERNYALSSRRPERLAAALGRDIPAHDLRGLHRWDEPPVIPEEATRRAWSDAEPSYRGHESGAGAFIVNVLAVFTGLSIVLGVLFGPVALLITLAVAVLSAFAMLGRSRQPVEIRGGLLCTDQLDLPLTLVRSLRMVGPPELGWFRHGTDVVRMRTTPLWIHHAAVITTRSAPPPVGDDPFPAQLLPHGRLPPWPSEGGMIVLVGTPDPAAFEAAFLTARDHAIAGRPFRPDPARQVGR